MRKTSMTAVTSAWLARSARIAPRAWSAGGCRARSVPRSVSALKIFSQIAAAVRSPARRTPSPRGDPAHAPSCQSLRSASSGSGSSAAFVLPAAQVRFKACCRMESWSGLSPTSLTSRVRRTGRSRRRRLPPAGDRRRRSSRVMRGTRYCPSLMASASPGNCAQSPRKSDRIVSTM